MKTISVSLTSHSFHPHILTFKRKLVPYLSVSLYNIRIIFPYDGETCYCMNALSGWQQAAYNIVYFVLHSGWGRLELTSLAKVSDMHRSSHTALIKNILNQTEPSNKICLYCKKFRSIRLNWHQWSIFFSFKSSLPAKGFWSAPLPTFVRSGADRKPLASEEGNVWI